MLNELVQLFNKRTARPRKAWPDYDCYLDKNLFPSHILTSQILDSALSEQRIELIRQALAGLEKADNEVKIKYVAPWTDGKALEKGVVEVIISHSVMEHVEDIDKAYSAMYEWLKPGGFISHQIDFRSHGTAETWNGYWTYSEIMWRIMSGKLPYLINRQPCSAHISVLTKLGFDIVCFQKRHENSGIKRTQLDSRWQSLSDDDLKCSGLFIQAKKR